MTVTKFIQKQSRQEMSHGLGSQVSVYQHRKDHHDTPYHKVSL